MNPERINQIIGELQEQLQKLEQLTPPPDGYHYIHKELEWAIHHLRCSQVYADRDGGG
jgi:hypothetical protein